MQHLLHVYMASAIARFSPLDSFSPPQSRSSDRDMTSPPDQVDLINVSFQSLPDIRLQFKEKLQPFLVDYPHLNLSACEYNDEAMMAQGGYSDVYRAHTLINGCQTHVALKYLRTTPLTNSTDRSASAKVAKSLSSVVCMEAD